MPRAITGRYFTEPTSGVTYFIVDGNGQLIWRVNDFVSAAHQGFDWSYPAFGYFNYIGAKDALLVAGIDTSNLDIYNSTDGGDNFSFNLDLGTFNYGWGYLRSLQADLSNGDLYFGSHQYPLDASKYSYVEISQDGGQSWNRTILHYPSGSATGFVSIAPRHDGQTCFVETLFSYSTSNRYVYVDEVNRDGTIVATYGFDPGTIFPLSGSEEDFPWSTCVSMGNSDYLFGCLFNTGDLWKLQWSTQTWSEVTSFTPTANQIIHTTRNGTLLILEVLFSSPWRKISRSTNLGTSFSEPTLPTLVSGAPISLMIATNNQIAGLQFGGKFLYSDDDGATWALSAVVSGLETADAIDQCAAAT